MANENFNDLDNLDNLDINKIEALYSDILEGPNQILIAKYCYCMAYTNGNCMEICWE